MLSSLLNLHAIAVVVLSQGLAATAAPVPMLAAVDTPTIELRIARISPAEGFVRMEGINAGQSAFVRRDNILSDAGIEDVTVTRTQTGLVLDIQLSTGASARLVQASKNIGHQYRLAILVGSRLANVVPIVGPLSPSEGRFQIGLELPGAAADEIAALLAARWP